MDYMMEWDHAPRWTMDDLFGIKSEVFPPVEKLNEEQMLQLVNGILELWSDFNIGAYIPNKDTPVQIVYKVLINYWKTKTVQYISEGRLTLEFCHYDENACPWGYEFCTCKDFEDGDLDMNIVPKFDNSNDGGDELPF